MKSISNQILAYILITLSVVFIGRFFYRVYNRTQFENERSEKINVHICERIAYFVDRQVLNQDLNAVKKNINFEASDENIGSIQILDQNNQLFGGVVRIKDKVHAINGNRPLVLHQDSIVRPVLYQGKTIGKVILYPNKEPLQKILGTLTIMLFLESLVLFLIIAILLFLIMKMVVINPLSTLKDWVSSINVDNSISKPKLFHSSEVDTIIDSVSQLTNRLISTSKESLDKSNQISEREALITNISANLPDGMIYRIIVDNKGGRKFTYLSDTVKKKYGISAEEAINDGSLIFRKLVAEDEKIFTDAEVEALRDLSAFKCQVRMVNPDGTIRFSKFVSTPTILEDGSVCWDGIELDITNLKKAQTELQESQFLLQTIANGTPDGIFAKDLDGRFLFVNSVLAKHANKNPEELLGKDNSAFFPADQAKKARTRDLEILKSGKIQTFEEQFVTSSGDDIVFLTTKGPIKDVHGETIGLFGIAVDITELKKTQADLQQSQFLLQSISEGSPDLIFAKDLDGRFLFVNSETARRANKNPKELLGKNDFEVYPPDEAQKIMETDLKIMESGNRQTFEEKLTTPSGNVFYLTTKGPIKDMEGKTVGLFGIARDITALKKAQTDLQENQFLLQSITEGLPDSIFAKDLNGRFLFANSAVAKQANMSPEELLGKDNSVIFPSDEAKKTWEMDLEVMKSGKILTFEEQVTTSSGNVVHLTTKGPIKDAQGKTIGLFGIGRDITERKNAEEALRVSQEKFEFAFSSNPDGIIIMDTQSGVVKEVNDSIVKILGYSHHDEIVGKTALELNVYKDKATREKVYEVLNTYGYIQDIEVIWRHKSGTDLHLILNSEYHHINNERLLYVVVQNVTESKRKEEVLRVSQEKFEFAFNSSPNAIFIQDEQTGKYTEANVSNERIFGYSREEVVGKSSLELDLYKDPTVREKILEIFNEQGYVRNLEVLGRHISGTDLHLLLTVQRHYIDNNPFMYIDLQNVTERKKVELELQKLNLDKDRFISILGHDLRSPVSSILLLLEVLHTEILDMPMEEMKEIIGVAYKSAKNTSKLLDDVLLWATSQSGKMKFDPQIVTFKDDCLNVIELLQTNANSKNIAIELDCEDSLGVYVDKNMLDTVLRNLISNALKFTRKGGKITVLAEKTTENTVISVTDNGVGISPEDIDKIFDKTQLFTSIGTNAEKGTGFGLKLCQEFVEKHGGKIWVESEVGKGATFYFSLPNAV